MFGCAIWRVSTGSGWLVLSQGVTPCCARAYSPNRRKLKAKTRQESTSAQIFSDLPEDLGCIAIAGAMAIAGTAQLASADAPKGR
jgi:hypothetical protein